MRKIFIAFFFCFLLSGCQSPEICGPTEEVTIEKILPKPDLELLVKEKEKKLIQKGSTNADVGKVMSDNNLRSNRIERRWEGLRTYVCNSFKNIPKEYCD